jgi:hypothetical protein
MAGKMPPPGRTVTPARQLRPLGRAIFIEGWGRAKTAFSDRAAQPGCRTCRTRSWRQLSALERREQAGSKQFRRVAAARRRRWADSHSARSQPAARRWPRAAQTPNPGPARPVAFAAPQHARIRQARTRRRQALKPPNRPANDCAPKNSPSRRERPDHSRPHGILAAISCRAVMRDRLRPIKPFP